uniref:N-(5'-phosphoribosyl)anthranilate isomerase n=1 Tax=Candidatus Kentrum sp. DK TaxID=2126562 RepID=A0A450SG32_9GAMM|nr:MAG: phosphoribosylanthranilate isomerase [Candidatus Kentron sp. DK]VFJ53768.1 MAG: phosphoribosylanthranilate isomerase [Candidatus Kentron sp. DK]
MRTRTKICGITRPEDGLAAARLGADAIGLVFYSKSPRAVDLEAARAISAALPPFVSLVALFVNPAPALVEKVLRALPIGLLQFHGDESPADCQRYGRPYVKAIRMRESAALSEALTRFPDAAALLLDAYREGLWGGTGERFDWSLIPRIMDTPATDPPSDQPRPPMPLILAGGLDPDNVREAVRIARPFAVDVSGGVESAKGIKDARKMARFIRAVSGEGA